MKINNDVKSSQFTRISVDDQYEPSKMKFKQILTMSVMVAELSLSGNWNVDTANAKINFSVKNPFATGSAVTVNLIVPVKN